MTGAIAPPFVYPGSKRRAAALVWRRLGHDVPRYIEPFAGSLGVLLGRPGNRDGAGELINDADGFVINAWRAIRYAAVEVAHHLEGPASTADLNARHSWMHAEGRDRVAAVFTDPFHYDSQSAAWWIYGVNVAVHPSRFTSPTHAPGRPYRKPQGHLANDRQPIADFLTALSRRLTRTIILAGDWSECVSTGVLEMRRGGALNATTAIFLDPPYDGARRSTRLYGVDSAAIAADVLGWCRTWGTHPQLRVCLAGYSGEHDDLERDGWSVTAWASAAGGDSRHDERLWFSPGCLSDVADGVPNLLEGVALQ